VVPVSQLPDLQSEYSTCLISLSSEGTGERIAYFVSRYSDDVTVFVARAPEHSSTIIMYGPFYSAYRK